MGTCVLERLWLLELWRDGSSRVQSSVRLDLEEVDEWIEKTE